MKRNRALRPQRNTFGRAIRRRLLIPEVEHLDKAEILDLFDMGYLIPMLGRTTNTNTALANAVYFPKAIAVTTDQTIHQGDMVWWDPVNFTLKTVTSPNSVALGTTGGYCGVAAGSNVPGLYPDPAAGTPSEKLAGIQVQMGGTASLALQANDVIDAEFTPVTQAVDAQTVTRGGATSTNRVGFVIVPAPVTPRGTPGATPASDTVAGGQRIEVWIERKFPSTVLI